MPGGYDPITYRHRMAKMFDLDRASINPSFARFRRRMSAMLAAADG